jgi:hypothetical protein
LVVHKIPAVASLLRHFCRCARPCLYGDIRSASAEATQTNTQPGTGR